LFQNISGVCLTTRCNTSVGQQRDFVRTINLTVAVSCKNLCKSAPGAISSSDQSASSSALTDINSSLQSDRPGSSTDDGNGFPRRSDSGEMSGGKLTGDQVAQRKYLDIKYLDMMSPPKVPWNLKSRDKSSALHNLKNRRQRERRRDRRVFS
jgi:hypothetical protein